MADTDIEWWDQPCPSCGRPRMAAPCSDSFHTEVADRRAVSIIQAIIERIAATGPPRMYAGNWPADQAERIVKALSDGGFEIVERPADGGPHEATAVSGGMSIGELREAIIAVMDLGGAWGGNMHESKRVVLRLNGQTAQLTAVSASFLSGRFVLVLDGPIGPESATS